MATNKVFKENTKNNRARVVPLGTRSGDFLIVGGRPAVALTDRGDATKTTPISGGASLTLPSGGFSLKPNEASLAFDGTWHLPVTGATTTTDNDVPVYLMLAISSLQHRVIPLDTRITHRVFISRQVLPQ